MRRPFVLSLALAACAPATTTTTTSATTATATAAAPAPRVAAKEIRWFRTAAEMRASYLQTYALATRELEREAQGLPAGTWAVISDADETILDNSAYQRERSLLDSAFTPATWDAFIRARRSTALPGAVTFARRVHELGGRLAVVTNRDEPQCDATRANLAAIGVQADVVLCQPAGTRGDKNPRFQAVENGTAAPGLPALRVLLWVGDNIQDFPNVTQAGIVAQPDAAYAEFGRRFFVLPNPMYGSWERNPDR